MKTYPRYFIGRLWTERDAYLRFDSQYRCVWVRNDGEETPQPHGPGWDADRPDSTWDEVTPEVARARLLPAQPEPLRWVENTKPDKPGIWAWQYTDWNNITNVSGIICASDLIHAASKGVRYCYLGPIPEILPPVKKVVERLWLERLSSSTQDGTVKTVFAEHWIPDDGKNSLPAFWIATSETREVEQ